MPYGLMLPAYGILTQNIARARALSLRPEGASSLDSSTFTARTCVVRMCRISCPGDDCEYMRTLYRSDVDRSTFELSSCLGGSDI